MDISSVFLLKLKLYFVIEPNTMFSCVVNCN